MQYTQTQIDKTNTVSLEDFLRTQGEILIKSGREHRLKEHDSLTVKENKWFPTARAWVAILLILSGSFTASPFP